MNKNKICKTLAVPFLLSFSFACGCAASNIQSAILSAQAGGESSEKSLSLWGLNPQAATRLEAEQSDFQWYYNTMTDEEKSLYDAIYEGYINWDGRISVNGVGLDTLNRVNNAVFAEHPELFYIKSEFTYYYDITSKDAVLFFIPEYCMSIEEYQQKWDEVQQTAAPVIENIKNQTSSDYEAELMAHDWLVDNITYDQDENEESADRSMVYRTLYRVFVNHKANCVGYSLAMTYLMNQLGIPCSSISGYALDSQGEKILHEWNFIEVEGQWYLLDVCWDDPVVQSDTGISDLPGISHAYFNLTALEMEEDHELQTNVNSRGDLPDFTSSEHNYFEKNGLVMDTARQYEVLVNDKFSSLLKNKTCLEVRFSSSEEYEKTATSQAVARLIQNAANSNLYNGQVSFVYYFNDEQDILMLEIEEA